MSQFLINGAFRIGGVPPLDDANLEGFLLQIGAARSRALEATVRNETVENRAGNARVNQLNRILQDLRAGQPERDARDNDGGFIRGGTLPNQTLSALGNDLRTSGGVSFFAAFLQFDNGRLRIRQDGDYQRLTENVRAEVDRASSDSQLNLIRLQGLINRNNQATEFVTNVVQRFSSLEDRINPNLRQ